MASKIYPTFSKGLHGTSNHLNCMRLVLFTADRECLRGWMRAPVLNVDKLFMLISRLDVKLSIWDRNFQNNNCFHLEISITYFKHTISMVFPFLHLSFTYCCFRWRMLNPILQSLVLVHLQLLASSAKYTSGVFRLGAQCNGHNEAKRRSRAASCKLPNSSYQANYCLG